MSKIIIACGGTGGHLAPGIAVAEVLQERGHECILLISKKQVDSALVEKYSQLNFRKIPGRAFTGGAIDRLAFIGSLFSGILQARRILQKESPDMVLLFGGFMSLGLGLAARVAGVPVAIHEANAVPGRSIRLLRGLANRIYLPEGLHMRAVAPGIIRYFGYPIRREIKHVLKADAWKKLQITVPNKLLVVIGGSQGASALNDWVVKHFEELAEEGISIYCVAGLGKNSSGSIHHINHQGVDVSATIVPFSDQMGEVVSAADLVISRAGAGAIGELIRCRAPSILVPYPFAADDHQCANARIHEQHGAGLVVLQDKLDTLATEVKEVMFNDWLLAKFKSNLERLDRFESSERIATDLEGICESYAQRKLEAMEARV